MSKGLTKCTAQSHLFFNVLVSASLVLSSATLAQANPVAADVRVLADCRVNVEVDKLEGEVLLSVNGTWLPAAKELPEMDIRSDGFTLHIALTEYLIHPDAKEILIGLGDDGSGEIQAKVLNYDVAGLRASIDECVKQAGNPNVADEEPASPDAPMLTPEHIQLQADELGIELQDYIDCPCGDIFAAVVMRSPPWHSDQFRLWHDPIRCSLSSRKKGKKQTEYITVSGTAGANIIQCSASMGLNAEAGRVVSRAKSDNYSTQMMQACFNIIQAKSRQWLAAGGSVVFESNPNDPKTRKLLEATAENLSCTAAK